MNHCQQKKKQHSQTSFLIHFVAIQDFVQDWIRPLRGQKVIQCLEQALIWLHALKKINRNAHTSLECSYRIIILWAVVEMIAKQQLAHCPVQITRKNTTDQINNSLHNSTIILGFTACYRQRSIIGLSFYGSLLWALQKEWTDQDAVLAGRLIYIQATVLRVL